MKMKKKTLLAQECEKREQIEGRERKGSGIVGLGLSRGILRTGLPSLPFFRCRRLKLGLEQIRSAYNMGHTARQG